MSTHSFTVVDSHEIFHQKFDRLSNIDVISTSKSSMMQKKQHKQDLLESLTTSSVQNLKKFSTNFSKSNQDQNLSNFKLVSKKANISIEANLFKDIYQTSLIKKIDFKCNKKCLINTFKSLVLIDYDPETFSYSVDQDFIQQDNLINSFGFVNANSDKLVFYDFFNQKEIYLYDYIKEQIFSELYKRNNQAVTTSLSNQRKIIQGYQNGSISIFDIRVQNSIQNLVQESNFDPIISLEYLDNQLIVSKLHQYQVYDIRKINDNSWIEQSKEKVFGIPLIQKYKNCFFQSSVGSKIIKKNNKVVINTQKKIQKFLVNENNEEVFILEGSIKPKISMYQKINNEYKKIDSIMAHPKTYEIGLDKSNENLLSLSYKHLQIYNFLSIGKFAKSNILDEKI